MSSSFPQRAFWGSTLLAVLAAATVSAQTSGGAIRGTISDPSGALVPGAGITIEEVSTSEDWRLVSSSAGLYNAPNLPVGRYNVTVKAPGFSTAERTNIDVQVGSESVVNVQLVLGKSEEKLTVASQAATVDLATFYLPSHGLEIPARVLLPKTGALTGNDIERKSYSWRFIGG